MQGAGDSSTLTRAKLLHIERSIEDRINTVREQFVGDYDSLYISFLGAGLAQISAELVYWPIRQLSDKDIRLTSGEEILYHTLPYHDERSLVILFSEPGTENIAAKISTTVRLTGNKAVLVSTPIPGSLAQYMTPHRVEISDEPIAVSFLIAAAKTAAILVEKYGSIRVRKARVVNEYKEISQIYEDLTNKYKDVLCGLVSAVGSGHTLMIYASPTLYSTPRILEYCISGNKIKIYNLSSILSHISLNMLKPIKNPYILFLLTDVESDIVREAKFKLNFIQSNNISSNELILHTDPLTAPLYASLLLNKACEYIEAAQSCQG